VVDGVEIVAWVSSIGDQEMERELDLDTISREDVNKSLVHCPDEAATVKVIKVPHHHAQLFINLISHNTHDTHMSHTHVP
jgi:chorismate synthase